MADERLPVATGLCNTCRFWFDGRSDFEDIAECRRNPPVRTEKHLIGTLDSGPTRGATLKTRGRGEWPLTEQSDSCGGYRMRKAAKIWDMGE